MHWEVVYPSYGRQVEIGALDPEEKQHSTMFTATRIRPPQAIQIQACAHNHTHAHTHTHTLWSTSTSLEHKQLLGHWFTPLITILDELAVCLLL